MVFFIATILVCLSILFYVIRFNVEQGKSPRKWDWVDWIRILVAAYWIFVSVKLSVDAHLTAAPHTTIYPGVVTTLALIAVTSIRKEKRVNGNGKH